MSKIDGKILVLDDDQGVLYTAKMILKQHFELVITEKDPAKLDFLLNQHKYDVIVLDMNFSYGLTSGKEGIKLLRKIIAKDPEAHVLMNTAYGDIEIAVEAMKEGAVDFLVKPWQKEKLLATVQAIYRLSQTKKEVEELKASQKILVKDSQREYEDIISVSESMKPVFHAIEKVAQTDANVLILGENGTGKELIARAIHNQSKRTAENFIKVDLGAIHETLFDSELFGHVKGAFTDAKEDRPGRFEIASGGSLFLDEIGNLSLPLQAKLLTALQFKQITRVGSNKVIPLDIRLICATNMPLYEMVAANEFRQDLLYRINTITLQLPPLRDRLDDIPLLAAHFLSLYKSKYRKNGLFVPEYVIKKLTKHSWPGNVRELQHAIERAVIMSDGKQLHVKDFSLMTDYQETTDGPGSYHLDTLEKWAISKAIQKHQGNISLAAKELGLSRGAMYRRLEKYAL